MKEIIEKYFTIRSITQPIITFEQYNDDNQIVIVDAITYDLSNGIIIKYDDLHQVPISNQIEIRGKFQIIKPYILFKGLLKKNGKPLKGVESYRLVKIIEYQIFDIKSDVIYTTLSISDDGEKIIKTNQKKDFYNYIFNDEFKFLQKIEERKKGTLNSCFDILFKEIKTTDNFENITKFQKNEELFSIFYEETSYFKLTYSINLYEQFYKKIEKDKVNKIIIQSYEEYKKINTYLDNLSTDIYFLDYLIECTLEEIINFIDKWIKNIYDDKIKDVEKNVTHFIIFGIVLFSIKSNKDLYIKLEDINEYVSFNYKKIKKLLKSLGLKVIDDKKSEILLKIKDHFANILLLEELNVVLEELLVEKKIVSFDCGLEKHIYLFNVFEEQKKITQKICLIQKNLLKHKDTSINEKIKKKFKNYKFKKDKSLNEEQLQFFNNMALSNDFSFHMLKGKPGTGKTTVLKHIISCLLMLKESNILFVSFQGTTKDKSFYDINKGIFPCQDEKYKSMILFTTINMLVNKVDLMNENIDKRKVDEFNINESYDLESKSIYYFKQFYKKIKILIIEEASNVSFDLFCLLFSKLDNLIKVIIVGDSKQCISKGISVMNQLEIFILKNKKENLTILTKNNRISNNEDNYLINNIDLVYENSKEIEKSFMYDEDSSVELFACTTINMNLKIREIYKKHEGNIEIFTFKNDDANIINKELNKVIKYNINENVEEYNKLIKQLVEEEYFEKSIISLGNKIMNRKNVSNKLIENCFIFQSEDLKASLQIKEAQKKKYKHFSYNHANIISMFVLINLKGIDWKISLVSVENDYLANGNSGYIIDIKYGVQFLPRNNNIKKKIKKNKEHKVNTLLKTHYLSPIKIVTIAMRNGIKKNFVVSINSVNEDNIKLSYCTTIDIIQGSEHDVGMLVIPEFKFNKSSEEFWCVNRLLVAISRSAKKLYIMINSMIEVDQFLLKGKKEKWAEITILYGIKYYTPTLLLQHIVSNVIKEKNSDFLLILEHYFLKIKEKEFETIEETSSKKIKN